MKNWKIPSVLLLLLILAMVFRWGNIGSSTNNGVVTKTKVDRWNGAIWQIYIRNGSYEEIIIKSSWFERGRKPIEKEEQYSEITRPAKLPGESFNDWINRDVVTTKTRIVKIPPEPIYWLSRDGLTKIWIYITLITVLWLIVAVILRFKSKKQAM